MSPTPVRKRVPEPRFPREKRSRRRYPIHLHLQYNVLKEDQSEHSGFGRTVNISGAGVLFETNDSPQTDDALREGRSIVLTMDRPLFVAESALTLVMTGLIVRLDAGQVAVSVEHYEFRIGGGLRH